MEVKVNICKIPGDKQLSLGVTDTSTDFIAEDSLALEFQRFRKSELVNVDVLEYKNIDINKIVTIKTSEVGVTNNLTIEKDGWYVIHHLLLPNLEWFNRARELGGIFYTYEAVYYTNENKYFKYYAGEVAEVTIEEIVNRNPLNTTISSYCKNYFSIFYLLNCYIKVSELLLSSNIKCSNLNLSELTFNRDLVWMTVNIINYYVSLNDLEGANILLNRLDTCNGICLEVNKKYNSNGCGCSK